MIHHDMPVRPWDVFGIDYHSKFLIIKKTEDLLADSLILTCKITLAENGLPKKIMSDSGGNFI